MKEPTFSHTNNLTRCFYKMQRDPSNFEEFSSDQGKKKKKNMMSYAKYTWLGRSRPFGPNIGTNK